MDPYQLIHNRFDAFINQFTIDSMTSRDICLSKAKAPKKNSQKTRKTKWRY